jgi:16S rRNA (cytidine1402-2'-O)-methyltransferase
MTANLYLIATPIGNLEDFTQRALAVIEKCEFLLVEDTRVTIKLLNHFQIKKKLISCHENNESQRLSLLRSAFQQGHNVGLIADQGFPLVSDPGHFLVKEAIALGMVVTPIPGASAFLLALVASGLNTSRFIFEGFLPDKQSQMHDRIRSVASEERTIIYYVSPHKVIKTLTLLQALLGDRQACLARELTKIHEEFLRGTLSQILDRCEQSGVRGELVLVVQGYTGKPHRVQESELEDLIRQRLDVGHTVRDISQDLANQFGCRKSDIYKQAIRILNEASNG